MPDTTAIKWNNGNRTQIGQASNGQTYRIAPVGDMFSVYRVDLTDRTLLGKAFGIDAAQRIAETAHNNPTPDAALIHTITQAIKNARENHPPFIAFAVIAALESIAQTVGITDLDSKARP